MNDYTPTPLPIPPKTWPTRRDPSTKATLLISTRREYLQPTFINTALSSPDMGWAQSLPPSALHTMLNTSLVLGLYTNAQLPDSIYGELTQIGMARLITDYTTCAYLTDVFVAREHRGKGMARWLVECVREVLDGLKESTGGSFRRTLLLSGDEAFGGPFYGKLLGAEVHDQKSGVVIMSTRPTNGYGGHAKQEEEKEKGTTDIKEAES